MIRIYINGSIAGEAKNKYINMLWSFYLFYWAYKITGSSFWWGYVGKGLKPSDFYINKEPTLRNIAPT